MTSIFEGTQPPKTRPKIPIKTRIGFQVYIHIHILIHPRLVCMVASQEPGGIYLMMIIKTAF